jgi:hypothetical protein
VLSQIYTFFSDNETEILAFGILIQTGNLSDPLLILAAVLNRVTLQEKDEATITCSRIRQLLNWKVDILLSKGLLVDDAETCLDVLGAFTEAFGFQNGETQKVRELVRGVMFKPESVGHTVDVLRQNGANTVTHYHSFSPTTASK